MNAHEFWYRIRASFFDQFCLRFGTHLAVIKKYLFISISDSYCILFEYCHLVFSFRFNFNRIGSFNFCKHSKMQILNNFTYVPSFSFAIMKSLLAAHILFEEKKMFSLISSTPYIEMICDVDDNQNNGHFILRSDIL